MGLSTSLVVFALGTLLIWPIIGTAAVELAANLRMWAYGKGEFGRVRRHRKLILAPTWPAVLVYALLVYPCVGIVNRLFLAEDGKQETRVRRQELEVGS